MSLHLQIIHVTVKGFVIMEAVPSNCLSSMFMLQPPSVILGFTIFSLEKPRTVCMPVNATLFGGNNKTSSKILVMVQKTSFSSSLKQLPELKRAVTCDKKSACRLCAQRRSEFAYELNLCTQHRYILGQSTFLDQVASTVRRTV